MIASVGPLLVPGRSKKASTSGRPSVEGPAQADELDEVSRDAGADRVDHALKEEPSKLLVGMSVSHDEPLVDTPCRVNLGVLFVGEQCLQSGDLLVGE